MIIDLGIWKVLWLRCGWIKHPCPTTSKSGEATLRVLEEFTPIKHNTFDVFIATLKSIPENSLIYRAWYNGILYHGIERINIGGLKGTFEIQAMPIGGPSIGSPILCIQ